jgi:hypothetical protein
MYTLWNVLGIKEYKYIYLYDLESSRTSDGKWQERERKT